MFRWSYRSNLTVPATLPCICPSPPLLLWTSHPFPSTCCHYMLSAPFSSSLSSALHCQLSSWWESSWNIQPKLIQQSWKRFLWTSNKAGKAFPLAHEGRGKKNTINSSWKIGIPSIRICFGRQKQFGKADSWGGHYKSDKEGKWQQRRLRNRGCTGPWIFYHRGRTTSKSCIVHQVCLWVSLWYTLPLLDCF